VKGLSAREQRLIALALAGAVLVGGWVFVVEPITLSAREVRELIPAREARLERRRQMVAQKGALAAELAQARQRLEAEAPRLLQGPTPPLAASELQKLVKDLAAEAGVEVRSERILPTADRTGVVEVPIEITVAGTIRQCVTLLSLLDRTSKLLTLQDVKIRSVSVGQPRDLLTTVTVSGYLLPAAPRPVAGGQTPPPGAG
jgi:Tfp pilus assembly protein PilO